jgi:hypothetical protein
MQALKRSMKLMPSALASVRTVSGAREASTLRKVCVIGAAGGIGQPLGLLMKMVRATLCASGLARAEACASRTPPSATCRCTTWWARPAWRRT